MPSPRLLEPPRPPSGAGMPRWVMALAVAVVVAFVGGVLVADDELRHGPFVAVGATEHALEDGEGVVPSGRDDNHEAAARSADAPALPPLVSRAIGGRSLTIRTDPTELWGEVRIRIWGDSGPFNPRLTALSVGVFHAPAARRDAKCPGFAPSLKRQQQGWTPLVTVDVRRVGRFRQFASVPAPPAAGTYRLCGYVERFPRLPGHARSLIVTGSLKVTPPK